MVTEKFHGIQRKIASRAEASGRKPSDMVLVCVVKEARFEDVEKVVRSGATDIGENRVQDAIIRQQRLEGVGRPVRWHFIGHLQTNKVKKAVEMFDLIHSVDSEHLAERIQREAERLGKMQSILMQVNVSGEDSKFGIAAEEAGGLVKSISGMKHLMLMGLMAMPPYSENPEDSRPHFARLRKLRDSLRPFDCDNVCMRHLSMGMSGDFEVAIEEGADIVRIGSAIFK